MDRSALCAHPLETRRTKPAQSPVTTHPAHKAGTESGRDPPGVQRVIGAIFGLLEPLHEPRQSGRVDFDQRTNFGQRTEHGQVQEVRRQVQGVPGRAQQVQHSGQSHPTVCTKHPPSTAKHPPSTRLPPNSRQAPASRQAPPSTRQAPAKHPPTGAKRPSTGVHQSLTHVPLTVCRMCWTDSRHPLPPGERVLWLHLLQTPGLSTVPERMRGFVW
jgi:hypothetical protein